MRAKRKRERVGFKVVEKLGVLSGEGRCRLEVRRVSWGGREPKLDVRRWWHGPEREETPLSGIALSAEEWEALGKFWAAGGAWGAGKNGSVSRQSRRG